MKRVSINNISKYRSVIMGFEILLIIAFHFAEDCKVDGVKFDGIVRWFYHYIRSSGVDSFLLVSGFGLYYSWIRNPNYVEFWKKRLSRVLVPYLVVAVLAWGWKDLYFNETGLLQFLEDISFVSLFTRGVKWFWYIFMSLVCYLVFPLIFNLLNKSRTAKQEFLKVAVIWLACSGLTVFVRENWRDVYAAVDLMVPRFPAFVLGCWLGKMAYENREIGKGYILTFMAVSFVLSIPLGLGASKIWGRYVAAAFNYGLCIILIWAFEISANHAGKIRAALQKFLEWFGSHSLELYLLHVMVRNIMRTCGYKTSRYRYELLMIIISILLSVILKKFAACMQGKSQ